MKCKKQILSFALAALLAVSPVAAETYGTLPDDEDVLQAHLDPGLCDADGDGGVSLTDALLTLQYAAGKNIGLKGERAVYQNVPFSADADGDGSVTVTDSLVILQKALGKAFDDKVRLLETDEFTAGSAEYKNEKVGTFIAESRDELAKFGVTDEKYNEEFFENNVVLGFALPFKSAKEVVGSQVVINGKNILLGCRFTDRAVQQKNVIYYAVAKDLIPEDAEIAEVRLASEYGSFKTPDNYQFCEYYIGGIPFEAENFRKIIRSKAELSEVRALMEQKGFGENKSIGMYFDLIGDKFFNNNVLLFEYDFGIHGDIIDDGEISSVTVEGTTANVVFKSNVPASENPNARFSMTVTAAEVPASAVEGCESFNIEVVR